MIDDNKITHQKIDPLSNSINRKDLLDMMDNETLDKSIDNDALSDKSRDLAGHKQNNQTFMKNPVAAAHNWGSESRNGPALKSLKKGGEVLGHAGTLEDFIDPGRYMKGPGKQAASYAHASGGLMSRFENTR